MRSARRLSRAGTVFHILEMAAAVIVIIFAVRLLQLAGDAGKNGVDLATGQDPDFPGAGYIAVFGMGIAAFDVLGIILFYILALAAGVKLAYMAFPVIYGLRVWKSEDSRKLRKDGMIKVIFNGIELLLMLAVLLCNLQEDIWGILAPIGIWGVFICLAVLQMRNAG